MSCNIYSEIWNVKTTLMISTSWSTPLSPGKRGWYKINEGKKKSLVSIKSHTKKHSKYQMHTTNYLTKQQLSKNTACRPYINCGSILCCSKNKLRSSVVSWTDVGYIWFPFYLYNTEYSCIWSVRQQSANWSFISRKRRNHTPRLLHSQNHIV